MNEENNTQNPVTYNMRIETAASKIHIRICILFYDNCYSSISRQQEVLPFMLNNMNADELETSAYQ